MSNYTEAQLKRVQKDMEKMAKEEIVIEMHEKTIQAFGSEIAILRIANNYDNKKAKYSENLDCWYITIVD
jgi:hypothetical protein